MLIHSYLCYLLLCNALDSIFIGNSKKNQDRKCFSILVFGCL